MPADRAPGARRGFPCGFAGCDRVAATVEVVPAGRPYADRRHDLIHTVLPGAPGTLRISGFLPWTNVSMPVADLAAAAGAVRDLDGGALRRLDRDLAPFYCRHCDRSYCGDHWRLRPSFDVGFDYWSGTCPEGHRHVIDH